ncbi:MAG TPA: hypothetical protein VGI30_13285, partial [Caulobacteraceae bacterium]
MLHLTMDCYYRSSRGDAAVLRDRVKIKAAGRSIAIEEAYRRAEFLRATYFELRDPSQHDHLVYSSMAEEKPREASRAPHLPCAITARTGIPGAVTLQTPASPAPSFTTVKEF